MTGNPLDGARVVVTRPEGTDGALATLLRNAGADPLLWASIAIAPPSKLAPLFDALRRLDDHDWIAFTSPRAVEAVLGLRPDPPERCLVAAVGPSTAAALAAGRWPVDLLPTSSSGAALADELARHCPRGSRVLFPTSQIARRELPERLAACGVVVEQLEAYRTEPATLDREACRSLIHTGSIDAVTFASPSAVDGLHQALGDDLFSALLANAPAVAIGATTAATLDRLGHTAVVARHSTLEALVETTSDTVQSRQTATVSPGEE